MNYPDENVSGQNPRPDDELPEDPELKNLLGAWKAPEVAGSLDQRVLATYRGQFPPRSKWRWLAGSIRLPAPVAAAAALLLLATSYLAARKATVYSLESAPAAPQVKIVEVPVPVVRERVVTRVVYKNAGARKAKEGPAPVSLPPRGDLADFRPVSEIKIIVSHGGSDAK
jgi:hypothetical protein